jgi:hypothetical protein
VFWLGLDWIFYLRFDYFLLVISSVPFVHAVPCRAMLYSLKLFEIPFPTFGVYNFALDADRLVALSLSRPLSLLSFLFFCLHILNIKFGLFLQVLGRAELSSMFIGRVWLAGSGQALVEVKEDETYVRDQNSPRLMILKASNFCHILSDPVRTPRQSSYFTRRDGNPSFLLRSVMVWTWI